MTTLWRFESNGWPRDRLIAFDTVNPLSGADFDKPEKDRSTSAEHTAHRVAEIDRVRKLTGTVIVLVANSRGGLQRSRTPTGTMTALAGAPSSGNANSINDRDTVIGHSGTKAWVLDDGVPTYLDDLPAVRAAGFTFMIPIDINERGWIVGWANTPRGQRGLC